METERYMARMSWFAFLPECWKMRIRRSATGRCLPSTIGAETIFRSGCECEAAKNRGTKPAEMPGSHRVFAAASRKKEKIRPKIKKYRQKQAKGDIIDKNSKRKRVGFAIAIYPREGTETYPCCRFAASHALQFIPARGRKLVFLAVGVGDLDCNLSPRGDGNI